MITEITSREQFEAEVKEGKVLVKFYSKTCGPCKMLAFVLKDVDKIVEDSRILSVDFDQFTDLKEELNVAGFPTMIMFKDGEEKARLEGLKQKPVIIETMQAA